MSIKVPKKSKNLSDYGEIEAKKARDPNSRRYGNSTIDPEDKRSTEEIQRDNAKKKAKSNRGVAK